MSYDSKLAQTGRKVASARRKYYGSFDYGSGLSVGQRGGAFSFGRKFEGGGPEYNDGWIDENGRILQAAVTNGSSNPWFDFKNINWGGLAGVATGFIGDTASGFKDMSDKYGFLNKKVSQYNNGIFDDIYDNNGLLSALGNASTLSDISDKDIRNKTVGQDIGSALTTGLNAGLSTGNVWVGLGAAALDAGKSVLQRMQAKSYADRVNQYIKDKNIRLNREAFMAGNAVDAHNDWMRMMSYFNNPYDYAFGGALHTQGGDYNGGLTYIDEGGRHEDNPYEGVPSGVDAQGNPNLVEEGEVIWNNDYVFSDRLKIPKELATKYKLGGKKEYTFAEAIEKLTKENTISPNDPITIATTKEIVNEFMQAQEAIREENQLAAKEELETAQMSDFLAQLDAAQSMGMFDKQALPPMSGQGMALPQMGALPDESPVTEGDMVPPGYAFGGNKFEGGGPKVVRVGNKYFITSEDSPSITGKMYGNKFVIDDQFKNLPSFDSLEEANREAEKMRRTAMPALEYQSDIEASGVVANTGNKILREQTGYNTKGQPIYRYTVVDPNNGKKYTYSNYQDAAHKYSSIPRKVNDPRVKGEYAYVTPYGDIHISEKDARKALNARFNPQSASAKAPKSTTNKGIGTTAMAAETPARASTPSTQPTQQPVDEIKGSAGAQPPTSGRSSTGRMTTPSGETINYRRDINGKEWEAAEPYQNFLSYMRGKGKDDAKVKEWMDYIQSEIKNSGSKYELKDFDDWSRLAEDGKVGPVHQATLKAAEYFAKRQGLQAVDPTKPLDPTLEEILGATPATAKNIPTTPASSTSQNTTTTVKEPQFNYKPTWQRDVPIIGSAMAALYGMLNNPDYFNADEIIGAARTMGTPVNIPVETIGDYRKRKPFDERYLVNMANQNRAAATRGIVNTSGGNRSMDLLGNMALAHNNQTDLGEIMRQAYLANRQDDAQVAEFNRGTNIQNMNAINQRNMTQAHLNSQRQQAMLSGLTHGHTMRQNIKDAWNQATTDSLESFLASIGLKGRENEQDNMLMSMAEQRYYPWYYGDRGILQFVPQKKGKGGKLNRKKRRF